MDEVSVEKWWNEVCGRRKRVKPWRKIPSSSECSAQGQVFYCNTGTKIAVLSKGRSSTGNSGTKVAVLLGINRCGSFPLLSAPHSLFSIWTDLERSENIPGTEWIWLFGPYRLHQNIPQGLNISSIKVFEQIRDPEIPSTLCPHVNYRNTDILLLLMFLNFKNNKNRYERWKNTK